MKMSNKYISSTYLELVYCKCWTKQHYSLWNKEYNQILYICFMYDRNSNNFEKSARLNETNSNIVKTL